MIIKRTMNCSFQKRNTFYLSKKVQVEKEKKKKQKNSKWVKKKIR